MRCTPRLALIALSIHASTAAALDDAERSAAAAAAAERHRACIAIQPFYWEVGRAAGPLAGGTAGGSAPTRDTRMRLASATKWLYAAYVVERRGGRLEANDVKALGLRSGWSGFIGCNDDDSIGSCWAEPRNRDYVAAHDGKFLYDSAQLQRHAAESMGLAALGNAALAAEMRNRLGADSTLEFAQPHPAAGGLGTPAGYARVLQRIVGGELRMRELLGAHAVHTHPGRYPDEAVFTPVPHLSWSYSLGHWVEHEPGDGAFSSAGVFGFYPWIDAGKTTYGLVARSVLGGSPHPARQSAVQSAVCGQAIREAWFNGRARSP